VETTFGTTENFCTPLLYIIGALPSIFLFLHGFQQTIFSQLPLHAFYASGHESTVSPEKNVKYIKLQTDT